MISLAIKENTTGLDPIKIDYEFLKGRVYFSRGMLKAYSVHRINNTQTRLRSKIQEFLKL